MARRHVTPALLATALAVTALSVLTTSVAAGKLADAWAQFGKTAQHVGKAQRQGVFGPQALGRLHVDWIGSYGSDAADESSPVIANGTAYVAGFDGRLSAFPVGGCATLVCQPLWQGVTANDITGAPAVADGEVLVASADHRLYAFPAAGCGAAVCAPDWTADLGDADVSSSVAVDAGRAYVGTFGGRLLAFATRGCGAASCRPLFAGQAHGHLVASPTVGAGSVFIGSDDGTLFAFPARGCGFASCAPTWTAQLAGPDFQAAPTLAGSSLFVATSRDPDGPAAPHLEAFAAAGCGAPTCRPRWRGDIGPLGATSTPAVTGHTLLVSAAATPDPNDLTGVVQAFDTRGCGAPVCRPQWTGVNDTAGAMSSPAVADGVVFVAKGPAFPDLVANVGVFAYRAAGCGARLCRPLASLRVTRSGFYAGSSIAIADGHLLFGAEDTDAGGRSSLFALATG